MDKTVLLNLVHQQALVQVGIVKQIRILDLVTHQVFPVDRTVLLNLVQMQMLVDKIILVAKQMLVQIQILAVK